MISKEKQKKITEEAKEAIYNVFKKHGHPVNHAFLFIHQSSSQYFGLNVLSFILLNPERHLDLVLKDIEIQLSGKAEAMGS